MGTTSDRTGQQFGNYRLIRRLGRGGFAEVYLGEHIQLERQAAIKLLSQEYISPKDREAFLREARVIARLEHPHIVALYDFGIEENTPYLIMGYAPYGTLRQEVRRGTQLPLEKVVEYTRQVAEALQYAHNERVIHRDIKPENMLLGRRKEVLVSDFGIAIAAHSEHSMDTLAGFVGTPQYMAPEQASGRPSPASDQYALALVVYEWLAGELPFKGQVMEVLMQQATAPMPPLETYRQDLPSGVNSVLARALAKNPAERFPSIEVFANALEEASKRLPPALYFHAEQPGSQSSVLYSPADSLPGQSAYASPAPGFLWSDPYSQHGYPSQQQMGFPAYDPYSQPVEPGSSPTLKNLPEAWPPALFPPVKPRRKWRFRLPSFLRLRRSREPKEAENPEGQQPAITGTGMGAWKEPLPEEQLSRHPQLASMQQSVLAPEDSARSAPPHPSDELTQKLDELKAMVESLIKPEAERRPTREPAPNHTVEAEQLPPVEEPELSGSYVFESSELEPEDSVEFDPEWSIPTAIKEPSTEPAQQANSPTDASEIFKQAASEAETLDMAEQATLHTGAPYIEEESLESIVAPREQTEVIFIPARTDQDLYDFFISYTKADRVRAQWIQAQLEQAGYTVFLPPVDFREGFIFRKEMDKAYSKARRMITVLSPAYFRALLSRKGGWNRFKLMMKERAQTFFVVCVDIHAELQAELFGQENYLDLAGEDESMARAMLRAYVRGEGLPPPPSPPLAPEDPQTTLIKQTRLSFVRRDWLDVKRKMDFLLKHHPEMMTAELYRLQGTALAELKERSLAYDAFWSALALVSGEERMPLLEECAKLLMELGNWQGVLNFANEALELAPNSEFWQEIRQQGLARLRGSGGPAPRREIAVFFSYSQRDEKMREELEKYLSVIQREYPIRGWHKGLILPGDRPDEVIDLRLSQANLVLLLISPDYLASNYCYEREMLRAIERHEAGMARVIPILLRTSNWRHPPFTTLKPLPRNEKPITAWTDRDKAYLDVANGIEAIIKEMVNRP